MGATKTKTVHKTTPTTATARKAPRRTRTVTATTSDLLAAIKRAKPVAARPQTTGVQAFTGVLIQATRARLTMDAYTPHLGVRVPLPGTGNTGFKALVSVRELEDAVKVIGTGEVTMTTTSDEDPLVLKLGKRTMQVPQLRIEDWPTDLKFDAGTPFLKADATMIEQAIKPAMVFASRDDTRPILTALAFDQARNRVVATDSYRLGAFDVKYAGRGRRVVLVPASALKLALAGGTSKLAISETATKWGGITGAWGTISTPDATYVARLIDGQFPNYAALLPDTWDATVTLGREAALSEVRFVESAARRNAPIRLTVTADAVQVATNNGKGEPSAEGEVAKPRIKGVTEPVDIGLNPEFVREALDALTDQRGGKVRMNLIGPLRPMLLTGSNGWVLTMPVRLQV